MPGEQRRRQIYELIREDGGARVSVLSNAFDVSEPTIRSDLEKLERDGMVVRDHGGAYLCGVDTLARAQNPQHTENADKKRLIAEKAAEYISDGDTLILDSGSTVTELARRLTERRNLHIVTNALNIAHMAGSVPSFTVDVTGGVFEARTLSLTGELAASLLKTVSVDRLFLGTAGISPDFGLTYPGLSDLPVKRAMIGASRFVYLLADSTKIGKTCFAALGALSAIDLFITDDGIDTETVRVFEEMGVEVAVAARGTAGGRAAVQCTEEVGMRFKE